MDWQQEIKHGLDRVGAGLLLVLLSPALGLIALAIRLDTPGGPLFRQERIGVGGRAFTIFKFRTMRQNSEADGLGVTTAGDDDRITRIGRFLRATSFDEVPQLLNIVRGEMSFIGPRPTLRYQVERYTPEQWRRLRFRPGITGWAQINGRNEIPWERRIELDNWYIDNYSLRLDLTIFVRTLLVILRGSGVYAEGSNDAFAGRADVGAWSASPEPAVGPSMSAKPATSRSVSTATKGAVPRSVVAPRTAGDARPVSHPVSHNEPSPMRLPLLVVGAGGHARVIVDIAEKQGRYQVIGLVDDSPERAGNNVLGHPVLGGREVLDRDDLPAHAVVAIGSADARAQWQEHLEEHGFQLAVLVHPAAVIGRDVAIGAGTVLMAGAIVNSGSRLGRGVIVNTGSSIDHDCTIGDFVHVAPGARLAGGVRVGVRSHVGIGSCVIQNVHIGERALIGAGAAVVRDVEDGVTAIGVPARPFGSRSYETNPQPTLR